MIRLLLIDNYDSFTYNLVQYFAELGLSVDVVRNDQITLEEINERVGLKKQLSTKWAICLSPGPCTPKEAGVCVPIVKNFSGKVPILGVCLGHQSIGAAFGGDIIRAKRVMHGKCDVVQHDQTGVFQNLPDHYQIIRYHSLVIDQKTIPSCLRVNAHSSDGEIMGVEHKEHPTHGIQFHPESILTEQGKPLLQNFIHLSQQFWSK